MEYIFSFHAEERMLERRIRKEAVIEVILSPETLVKRTGKYYAQKMLGGRMIEVVYERTQTYIKVITVYWT